MLCGAAQSDGFRPKVRADAGAAPINPEGAAALVAARLLGAKCVREAISAASAALQVLRTAAAAAIGAGNAAEDADAGAGPSNGEAAAALDFQQPDGSPAAGAPADGDDVHCAAVTDISTAHRDKRQKRREDAAQPRPVSVAGATAPVGPDEAEYASSDEYLGDVSEVSMSDDDGNDAAAQRRKRAALLAGPGAQSEAEEASASLQTPRAAGGPDGAEGGQGVQAKARHAASSSVSLVSQEGQQHAAARDRQDNQPAKKQKKAKAVQKPKNRCGRALCACNTVLCVVPCHQPSQTSTGLPSFTRLDFPRGQPLQYQHRCTVCGGWSIPCAVLDIIELKAHTRNCC